MSDKTTIQCIEDGIETAVFLNGNEMRALQAMLSCHTSCSSGCAYAEMEKVPDKEICDSCLFTEGIESITNKVEVILRG